MNLFTCGIGLSIGTICGCYGYDNTGCLGVFCAGLSMYLTGPFVYGIIVSLIISCKLIFSC